MSDIEKLFECVLSALKTDIELHPYESGPVRELNISNQELAQTLGSDYRRNDLPPLLMKLMSFRSECAYWDGQYVSYKNLCTAYWLKKDGITIHIYTDAIKLLKRKKNNGKKEQNKR